jgi:hypothetical protein
MLSPSGNLHSFDEVVPGAAMVRNVSRSSILTSRRRVRVQAQGGSAFGSAGSGAQNNQIQFILSDAQGLVDPQSVNLIYTIQTAGNGNEVCEGPSWINRAQCVLNGALVEDIVFANRYIQSELALSSNQSWWKTAGSFLGLGLLNNELNTGSSSATVTLAGALASVQAYSGAWGDVSGNLAAMTARSTAAANAVGRPYAGEQRSLPLGCLFGLFRCHNYLPMSVLGSLNLTFFTAANTEAVFQNGTTADGTYSLSQVFIEYDVITPDPRYQDVIMRMANDPSEAGLNIVYESTIMASGGIISASDSALSDSTIVVSRGTTNLVRTFLLQSPSALQASNFFPSASCFQHANTFSIQWRVGSQYYPQVPAEGDASMFANSMLAYGHLTGENCGIIGRQLWAQTTTVNTAGLATTTTREGVVKFAFADHFIPAYSFKTVAGDVDNDNLIDGVNLAGASGSQLSCAIRSAPAVSMTPVLALVAQRILQASGGAVRVLGA